MRQPSEAAISGTCAPLTPKRFSIILALPPAKAFDGSALPWMSRAAPACRLDGDDLYSKRSRIIPNSEYLRGRRGRQRIAPKCARIAPNCAVYEPSAPTTSCTIS